MKMSRVESYLPLFPMKKKLFDVFQHDVKSEIMILVGDSISHRLQ